MKKMKLQLLNIIMILAISTPLLAQPEAVFNKITKEYTFHPDGSVEFRYNKELKINTLIALNKLYGESFIIYNPEFQDVKINTSYTRQVNGTIIKTPENAFNEVLPGNAANAPAYNTLKEMVVTHTGLELGATIYLDYTLSTKPGYYKAPDIDELLQEESPVKEYQIIINIPESQTFNYLFSGQNIKPVISVKDQIKQYRWTLRNLPATPHEGWLPANFNTVPRLTASGHASQEAALKDFSLNFTTSLDEAGERFTRELIKNSKKELDKIITIQRYVVDQVATCKLSLEETAGKVRLPNEVLNSSYGTLAEKVALFSAMLKVLGLQHEIVVTYPGTLNGSVKGLKPITDLKIQITTNGRPLFLSAVHYPSETPELRGNRDDLWLMSDKKIIRLEVINSLCEINYKANIKITPKKATSAVSILIGGGLIPVMDRKSTEKHIKALAATAGNTIISQINSAEVHSARLYFSAEQNLNGKNGYIVYKLPVATKGVNTWNMDILNSSRKGIFEIPYAAKENYEYELTLDPSMEIKTNEKQIEINKPFAKVRISLKKNGNSVKISKELIINKTQITPAEYPDFRKIILTWNDKNINNLIINQLSN